MAEPEPPLEGWQVPQRWGFLLAVAPPLLLATIVVVAAHFYVADLRPLHRQPVTTFPAPGVETFIHDGHGDPNRVPAAPAADPTLAAAKQAVVTRGIAGWGAHQ